MACEPGQMQSIDQAFYNLTVGQRDRAWRHIEFLETEKQKTIDAIMDAQADLQTGLGILRLEISQIWNQEGIQFNNFKFAEERLTESLARFHTLLGDLGNPMYKPATYPTGDR